MGAAKQSSICSTATIESVKRFMIVNSGETLIEYEKNLAKQNQDRAYRTIPSDIREKITPEHRLSLFHFYDDREGRNYGYGGYFISKSGCINYVQISYYDN